MALSTIQLRLLTRDCPDIPQLVLINQEAFPPSERASIDGLFDSNDGGNLDMIGIYAGEELAGFFAVRKFRSIRYLAYFAVSAHRRSGGIGSKALRLLKKYYSEHQMVIEFEAPDESTENNPIRLRRRDFYLRNGFQETGWYNFYDETEFEIACSEPPFHREEFEEFIDFLNAIVPIHMPRPYRKG